MRSLIGQIPEAKTKAKFKEIVQEPKRRKRIKSQ
jgi:hypothetical protein